MKRVSLLIFTITAVVFLSLSMPGVPAPTALARSSGAYQDPSLPVAQRVKDLLGRMTLDEKIGQMTLANKNGIKGNDIQDKFIGGLLSGGGETPKKNKPPDWGEKIKSFEQQALQTRLAIPPFDGIYAVYGARKRGGGGFFPLK